MSRRNPFTREQRARTRRRRRASTLALTAAAIYCATFLPVGARPALLRAGATVADDGSIAAANRPRPLDERGPVTAVAEARTRAVPVYADFHRRRSFDLANPQPSGSPLVFVVIGSRGPWLHVRLPIRPNGSVGWIPARTVRVTYHRYRIVVRLHAHRITVYRGEQVVLTDAIGVGRFETPTPGGVYYTKELLRAPDASGPYGPYAYGLSGFSNVLTRFAGGDGVIGIHGTNQPWLIGHDVSHGCIRMRNASILKMVHLLPLGVPVEIRA
jgi:lipoprotein-anchoring transpeptidase ErfK/SrfK